MSINLSNDAATTLKDLAARQGVSVTEVIRRSVSAEMWRQNVVNKGGKVLVEAISGRVHEVSFPY
jgi:hypothetical protein